MDKKIIGKNILIVEDDVDYSTLLGQLLEEEGFRVSQESDGIKALNLLRDVDVDLIILDMQLPHLDGNQFCYHLTNTLNKKIPVVVLTNVVESIRPEGCVEYIIKVNNELGEVVDKIKAII